MKTEEAEMLWQSGWVKTYLNPDAVYGNNLPELCYKAARAAAHACFIMHPELKES